MAQTLKEEVRKSIIQAAKQEFLEKGYKAASMRSIAAKANMTVGNLYRYYKNKEDINLSIVAPTFKLIDNAIKNVYTDSVNMEPRVFNVKPNIDDVVKGFDRFSDNLVSIFFKNKTEFNILFLHSRVSEEMIEKFIEIISNMLSEYYVLNNINNKNILAVAYGEALFAGLRAIFKEGNDNPESLKKTLNTYFKSFLYMLDNDFSKYDKQ